MMPATRSQSLLAFLAVAIVATLVVGPFFFAGNVSGHDFEFHTSSWLDVSWQWKHGVIYPRWSQWANGGFGEPRFIFYPPASWILGAALGLVLPWRAVPGAFICLVVMFSGMSMMRFARYWLPPRDAILAAILYAASPYALLIIYLRSDFAELLAASFFPLLVLYTLRTVASAPRARVTAALAAVFAAIWLCNAPAGVLATYTVCLLITVLAITGRSSRPLFIGIAAMALGFLLAGFFIVPAAFEQRWVNISRALSSGLRPEQNFLFTRTSDPEHNLFNGIVSAIAVGMLVLAGIAARARPNLSRHPGAAPNSNEERKPPAYGPLLALTLAAAALLFPISGLIWRWLPQLRFLQFPWRWLGPLGVPFAYFLASAIARARWRHLWQILALAAVVGSGLFLVRHAWWETDDLNVLRDAVSSGQGFEGTDEYDPLGDDHYDLPKHAPLVAGPSPGQLHAQGPRWATEAAPRIGIERWAPEEKRFEVDADRPAQIALRLLGYPAWRVEVNQQQVDPSSPPGTAQMIITIPAGHNRVRVRFVRTLDRTIGLALSAMGFIALLWLRLSGAKKEDIHPLGGQDSSA
ncbi:MAG TPA: 6-pyruvoyl-tetrahydropterin synthase-related protein [Candidatus Dormibacteraeota bacterium]|nr:6-pyruvoyl-tetrahydropterin synthase-related protein [Candidatus Dormibacteraeota bacterium]